MKRNISKTIFNRDEYLDYYQKGLMKRLARRIIRRKFKNEINEINDL